MYTKKFIRDFCFNSKQICILQISVTTLATFCLMSGLINLFVV